jgi:hypothetical protein
LPRRCAPRNNGFSVDGGLTSLDGPSSLRAKRSNPAQRSPASRLLRCFASYNDGRGLSLRGEIYGCGKGKAALRRKAEAGTGGESVLLFMNKL